MKLFFVVGTRPNLIKLSPIISIASSYQSVDYKIVLSNQHFDYNMSLVFFDELEIPKADFFIETDNRSHAYQTAGIMTAFEDICHKEKPDGIVVFGDVNTTAAAALVASKLNIPSFHIESGLRSFNKSMPEEVNRLIADHVCDVLFAPSEAAIKNLQNEGLSNRTIYTGDIMFDAVLKYAAIAEKKSGIIHKLQLKSKEYYLVTLHRPYNVDDKNRLIEIIEALSELDAKTVFSVHPRTLKNLKNFGITLPPSIITTEPLGYFDFMLLQKNAKKIITDSGGVQKEAFFLKTPCITLRSETEWTETLECKANILVPQRNKNEILDAVKTEIAADFSKNIYGDGHAAEIIWQHIIKSIRF